MFVYAHTEKWSTEPAVVNAFYNPNKNDIGKGEREPQCSFIFGIAPTTSTTQIKLFFPPLFFILQFSLPASCSHCSTAKTFRRA